jgi:hypothetical protein
MYGNYHQAMISLKSIFVLRITMPIVKATEYEPGTFFQMTKKSIDDEKLTWAAKGMLAYFMSKPPDWRVIKADLINRSSDGRKTVDRILHELIDAGYVVMHQQERDPKTNLFLPIVYTVYDDYEDVEQSPLYPVGDDGFGDTRFGDNGSPVSGKGTTTNNNISNNKENDNKCSYNNGEAAPSPEVKKELPDLEDCDAEYIPEYTQKDTALFRSRLRHMPDPITIVPETLIPADSVGADLMQRAGVLAFESPRHYNVWIKATQTDGIDCEEVVKYWADRKAGYNLVATVINQLIQLIEERE